jgi:hypothetical protein
MLKQIGMGASVMECNSTSHGINFVDKYPVALNMTVKRPLHRLIVRVISFKVFNHFCKGMKPLGRDFPPHHCSAFLNGGYSLGIVTRISSNRIVVRGADRTFACKVKPVVIVAGCRSKGKYSSSRRYFARHVNCQPVAGRYFYGLCNTHKENIA